MVYLAYDGSLNGDWVSRYAIRFAAHGTERTLNLLHVLDGKVPEAELERKIEHLRRECLGQGVELFPQLLPLAHGVFPSLAQAIPAGAESLVVCGTRVRSTRKPFLSGTVAELLLRHGAFPVLAVRVVQPGLLGSPRELLIPLAGHPRGLTAVWRFQRPLPLDQPGLHDGDHRRQRP
jgi:nucleotide-binding universal stress UspA family protein